VYSEKYKLLFIHIPKTAGSSMSNYVSYIDNKSIRYDKKNMDIDFIKKTRNIDKLICDNYMHIFLSDYKHLLNENEYNNSTKFTVVRDPINKLKSLYFYWKKINWINFEISEILPILYNSIKKINERGYAQDLTFKMKKKIVNCENINPNSNIIKMPYLEKYKMFAVDNLFDTFGILKQTSFFNIQKDNVNVLRFESLQNDLNTFTGKYFLPRYKLNFENKSNAHKLSDKEFLRLLIKNHPKDIIQYVFDYYKDDFKLLNYNCPNGLFSS